MIFILTGPGLTKLPRLKLKFIIRKAHFMTKKTHYIKTQILGFKLLRQPFAIYKYNLAKYRFIEPKYLIGRAFKQPFLKAKTRRNESFLHSM